MDVYRSVYVVAEDTEYGRWIQSFWRGEPAVEDALWRLLKPEDLRGEVMAWGEWPHWTVLDALTTSNPKGFAEIVKAICRLCPPPTIKPKQLSMSRYGLIMCTSPLLEKIRLALIAATHHLIARTPLTDEEFQKAEWWIQKVGKDAPDNLKALWRARDEYIKAGSPPLPKCRHFRLGKLVGFCKQLDRAEGKERESRASDLQYFLSNGEPPWYASSGGLHTTIASGLREDCEGRLNDLEKLLQPIIESKLGSYKPRYLAIMGEDTNNIVTVHFFDWLTETYVEEKRPGFKVIDRANFALSE